MTVLEIDAPSVIDWVQRRGVAPRGPLTRRRMSGGVSSSVWAVEGPTEGVVVKQALSKLRVEADWRADPGRSMTEGRALVVLGAITPERVPRLLASDADSFVLVIERAPRTAASWRDRLLAAPADPGVGAVLGITLAAWHRATWLPWDGAAAFAAGERAFEQLRLVPFYDAVAGSDPELADVVDACAAALRETRLCLVHGDVSPKNVLVDDGFLWVIDPEVAHIGDPVFDVAFMGAHLALAAIARSEYAASIGATWNAFFGAYLENSPAVDVDARLGRNMACLLLARADGVSPEPGLGAGGIERARRVARDLLRGTDWSIDSIWRVVSDAVG